MNRIEPIAARIPYMTCVGNHGNNLTNRSDVTTKTEEDAFHWTQNSGLNSWKLPLTNGTAIPVKINSRIIPKFLGNFLTENFFNPELPEFSVEWFAFRKFNNFHIFLATFPENVGTIWPR